MELKNNIYVVSLTQWDREWRFPFEKDRMLVLEQIKHKDGRISVSLGAKKILAVRIELAKRHF